MKLSIKNTILIIALLIGTAQLTALYGQNKFPADQPYASFWFPNQLLTWNPSADQNAAYNRGTIPLATRFQNATTQANGHARPNEGKVTALSIMYPTTSNNPSQGYLNINGYAFNYWQYTDVLVFWGGSAGEGLILAPNPTVIDAAHRNGVPVLGTIFFPPTAYGGKIQWVNDFLQKSGETFPIADKLIEVANYYGFDGFFINQETAGGNATTANNMRDFMLYFKSKTTTKQLMWYDSMTKTGSISWQRQLNTNNEMFFQVDSNKVSDKMFIDFGWSAAGLTNSRTKAQSLGRSQFDLSAGIDVQANGYNTSANWAGIFPEGQPHVTSLGLYCPNWCYSNSTNLADFYTKENRFWVGANRDPANTTTSSAWKGLANYIPESSPITEIPFTTNFCTGQGYDFYINGEKMSPAEWSTTGWNNLSVQDVLPTWRWRVESSGTKLYPEFDFTDAYYGGNCLKISGDLTADNHIKLYQTNLQIQSNTFLRIAYKTGTIAASNMKVGLAFSDNPNSFEFVDVGNSITTAWNDNAISISQFSGKTLVAVSLFFPGGYGSGYQVKVGKIGFTGNADVVPASPSNLVIERKIEENPETASLRIKWNHSTDPVYYYNIYRFNYDNNTQTYLGSTSNNYYFIPKVSRRATEASATIYVQAVSKVFLHSAFNQSASASFNWNVNSAPAQATQPMIANGSTGVSRKHACLNWLSGNGTTTHDIYFGAVNPPPFVVNQLNTDYNLPLLDASKTYYWRIDEKNSLGTTVGSVWSFTTAAGMDSNYARIATATASTQTSPSGMAAKAIDGITASNNEWISLGEKNPWIQLTWANPVTINAMEFHDRYNSVDKANGGTLTFSDGSTIDFNGIPNNGSAKTINFAPKTISSVKFQVVGGEGSNVGLSEIEAFYPITTGINEANLPAEFSLSQNYPNPFNPSTSITYSLTSSDLVNLSVYNSKGETVQTLINSMQTAGKHNISFDGSKLNSGIYFYKLEANGKSIIHKMMLLK